MKRKNNGFAGSSLMKKRMRFRGTALLLTILIIAMVILVNVAVGYLEDRWALKLDVTANQMTQLSEKTTDLLDTLDQPVFIYPLYQKTTQNDSRILIEAMLNEYKARSRFVHTEDIDPVSEPGRIKALNIEEENLSEGSLIVANEDSSRVRLIKNNELYDYTLDQQRFSYTATGFSGESRLTSAVAYVAGGSVSNVFFLTGHDELDISGCGVLTKRLNADNYDAKAVKVGEVELSAGDTVVVLAPTIDLTDEEYALLKDWLENGGRIMYVHDTSIDFEQLPNFKKLLGRSGLGFRNGYVVEGEDATENYLTDQRFLIPNMDTEHDITESISKTGRLVMPLPCAVSEPDMPLSDYTYSKLLTTSDNAYLKALDTTGDLLVRDENDENGPFTLAMCAMHQAPNEDALHDTRIALIGSIYTVADTNYLYSSDNLEFAMNVFEWLANRDITIDIRSKQIVGDALRIPNATTMWIIAGIVVLALPILVLAAGICVWLKRRHL